jgi:hypothetical protein
MFEIADPKSLTTRVMIIHLIRRVTASSLKVAALRTLSRNYRLSSALHGRCSGLPMLIPSFISSRGVGVFRLGERVHCQFKWDLVCIPYVGRSFLVTCAIIVRDWGIIIYSASLLPTRTKFSLMSKLIKYT